MRWEVPPADPCDGPHVVSISAEAATGTKPGVTIRVGEYATIAEAIAIASAIHAAAKYASESVLMDAPQAVNA